MNRFRFFPGYIMLLFIIYSSADAQISKVKDTLKVKTLISIGLTYKERKEVADLYEDMQEHDLALEYEHNGTIEVEGKEGEGSKFIIELPIQL